MKMFKHVTASGVLQGGGGAEYITGYCMKLFMPYLGIKKLLLNNENTCGNVCVG